MEKRKIGFGKKRIYLNKGESFSVIVKTKWDKDIGVIEYRLITCLNKSSDKKKELLILLDNLFLFSEKVIKDYNENKDKYLANKEELSGYYYTHGKLNLLMGLIDSSLKSLEESGETFTEEEKEKIEKNEDRLDMNYIG